MVDPTVDEAELLRQATEEDLVRRGLRMSEQLRRDPRLQSMLTVDRETYQSRDAGLPVDSEGGRTFIDIFDDSFEMMHGYKRAQFNRNLLFGQHPAFNFIAESGRSLGVMTGLTDQQPDFSDRKGFMGKNEEWENNQQFRLDATRLRFRQFEDFDGSKNSSLEYLIDPQYFKTIPGLKGQYITPESIPEGELEQFRKVVNSPSAALAYFEQRTGKAIYNYLRDSTSIKSSILSRRGNELLLEMTQPDMIAEDLLLFGVLNGGSKLIRFGKNFKRMRNEPAAVHKTTRRTLFGDDAINAVRAGKADEITDAFGRLKGAARGPAVATPVSGWKTSVGVATIFGGTELARQRMIVENRSLLGERDTMTEGVLFASVIGLAGGKFIADQVNQGIPTQQLRSLFDATEIEVTNQLRIRAEQKEVPVEALTDNDRNVAVQRSMEKIQQKTAEMDIDLEGGIGDKVVEIADRIKALPGPNQVTGPETQLTLQAETVPALNTILGKVAMDIARPEGQQVQSLVHDSIVNLRMVDHHMGSAVEQIEKNIEVSVDPSLNLHPEQVTPQALWRVSGEIAGELAIEPDSILDEQALILRFKQEGLILTEKGAKAVKRAVGHIRAALEPEVQKMLDSGFLNRELTDINPYHAARIWNEVALETTSGKKKLRALFRDYLKKHKYTEFMGEAKEILRRSGEDFPDDILDVYDPNGAQTFDSLMQDLVQRAPRLAQVFENLLTKDADHAVQSLSPSFTPENIRVENQGAKSYRSRTLTIPNNYEATVLVDGQWVPVRLYDYVQTHPEDLNIHLRRNTIRPLLSAVLNMNKDVVDTRALSARFLNDGDNTNAYNYNVAASLIEVFDFLGDSASSARIPALLQIMQDNAEPHRAALEVLESFYPEGETVRATSERYQMAEAIVLDALLGQLGSRDSFVSQLAHNRVQEELTNQQLVLLKNEKDYTDFDNQNFGDETPESDRLSGETQSLVEGVKPTELGESVKPEDRGDLREPISLDAGRLIENHPEAIQGQTGGEWSFVGGSQKLTNFDRVQDEKFQDNRRDKVTTGSAKHENRKEELAVWADGNLTFEDVIIDDNRRITQRRPFPVNETEMKEGRKGRIRTDMDRLSWDARQIHALREAAHTLFFYLSAGKRDEFSDLFIAPPNKVELKYSSNSEAVRKRAANRSEVFMEAVVRYAAGDKELKDFQGLVRSLDQLVAFVKPFADGFFHQDQRGFLGPRKASKRTPEVQAVEGKLNEIKQSRNEIKKKARTQLRREYGRVRDGDVGEVYPGVDPMGIDEAFVHGSPMRNIQVLIQNVAKIMELPEGATGRGDYLRKVTDQLKQDAEQGGEVVGRLSEFFSGLDDSRRVYEQTFQEFRDLRDRAFLGMEDYRGFDALDREVRQGGVGQQRTDETLGIFGDEGLVYTVPDLIGEFDSHHMPLMRNRIRQQIIEDGVNAAKRAETFFHDKMKVAEQFLKKYPNHGDSLKIVMKRLDTYIRAVQGRISRDQGEPLVDALMDMGMLALYAKFAPTMMLTQIMDLTNSTWTIGAEDYVTKNLPEILKAFKPLIDKEVKKYVKGITDAPFDDYWADLTPDQVGDLLYDFFGRKGLLDLSVIQDPMKVRAIRDNPRRSTNTADPIAPDAVQNDPGWRVKELGVDLSEKTLEAGSKAVWVHSKVNKAATGLIGWMASKALRAGHRTASELLIRDIPIAAKELLTPDYRKIADMGLEGEDAIWLFSSNFREAIDLDIAVDLGKISQDAADKVKALGADEFIRIKSLSRSTALDRARMIGFRDDEVIRLGEAIDAVQEQLGPPTKMETYFQREKRRNEVVEALPPDMQDLLFRARGKYSWNMNPVPHEGTVPIITTQNRLGRAIFVFTRFLTTASGTFLRVSNRAGGAPAMAAASGVTMLAMAGVEYLKAALKGEDLPDVGEIMYLISTGQFDKLDRQQLGFLNRTLNSSGQWGLWPEVISGVVFGENRYGSSAIPQLDMALDFAKTFTDPLVSERETLLGKSTKFLDRLGMGFFDQAVKYTNGIHGLYEK